MNLGTYLSRSARYWPDGTALVCGERTWTHTHLDSETNRLASALVARGLRPGDAVASLAWNRGELVEVEFALYKAGLTRAPINARLGRGEIEHILRYAPVRVLVFDAAHREDALAAIAAAGTGCVPVQLEDAPAHEGTPRSSTPPNPARSSAIGTCSPKAAPNRSASTSPRATHASSTSRPVPPARSRRQSRPPATAWPTCASS